MADGNLIYSPTVTASRTFKNVTVTTEDIIPIELAILHKIRWTNLEI